MKKLCLVLLFFTFHFVVGQTEKKQSKYPSRLSVSLGEYGPLMEDFIKTEGITKVAYVNDGQFLGTTPFSFNPELLTQEIERAVPNPEVASVVFIDLESPYLDYLMNEDVQSDSFQKSLQLFMEVIRLAKKMRPNTKWGFYGLPFTTYWNRTPDFYQKITKIEPLLQECDILFPSLYIFYEDSDKNYYLENKKYAIENTQQIIKISKRLKKSAYVFVWHRYHPSNEKKGNTLLPEKVYLTHIKRIINATFEGRKIDGIVWWGSDNYSFREKHQGMFEEFSGKKEDYKVFNDKILLKLAKKQRKIIAPN